MEKITLNVEGMSCGHCKQAVTGALESLEGVKATDVHVEQGTAEVEYDESKVTVEQMKDSIEEQGYDVR